MGAVAPMNTWFSRRLARSTPAPGQYLGSDADGLLDFFHDDFRRHGHASAYPRSGDDSLGAGDRRFDFPCHPPDDIKLRHNDMFGIFSGFEEFFLRPRPECFDLDQAHPYSFIGQQTDGFTSLGDSGS